MRKSPNSLATLAKLLIVSPTVVYLSWMLLVEEGTIAWGYSNHLETMRRKPKEPHGLSVASCLKLEPIQNLLPPRLLGVYDSQVPLLFKQLIGFFVICTLMI